MTSQGPSRRLIDVLNLNSTKGLRQRQQQHQLTQAMSAITSDELQTRFLRNHFLIDPKALRLLLGGSNGEEHLLRHRAFAVYKPAFCPMRRKDAHLNYNKVSVESFVNAALRSQDLALAMSDLSGPSYPIKQGKLDNMGNQDASKENFTLFETTRTQRISQILQQKQDSEKSVSVRVLYDLDLYASGPVIVSLTDSNRFATCLEGMVMHYDVLVAGHLPQKGEEGIDVSLMFPATGSHFTSNGAGGENGSVEESEKDPISSFKGNSTRCCWEAVNTGYYGVHAVTLLRVSIFSPPNSSAPRITEFVRSTLNTFVIGDPAAMSELLGPTADHKHTLSTDETKVRDCGRPGAKVSGGLQHLLNARGDCDFPRVFTHLRYVSVEADEYSTTSSPSNAKRSTRTVDFQCRKCFDSIVQKERVYSLKGRKIGLLDGTWTPSTEFIG